MAYRRIPLRQPGIRFKDSEESEEEEEEEDREMVGAVDFCENTKRIIIDDIRMGAQTKVLFRFPPVI